MANKSNWHGRYRLSAWNILALLLCLSVALNVLLANRLTVRQLPQSFIPDHPLSAIGAYGLDGKEQLISFSRQSRPTVLYVFSPDCIWCAHNLTNMRTLAGAIGGRFRIVGLSLSGTRLPEYLATNRIVFPVYQMPRDSSKLEYKLGRTPETMLIGIDGRIQKRWTGAWGENNQKDIERVFGVALPGLTQEMPFGSAGAAESSSLLR